MAARRRRSWIGGVAILVALCACAAAGTYWLVGRTPECGNPAQGPARQGWSARSLVSGGRERCYHLYVPAGTDPSQPRPVVVSLHGFLTNPNSHAALSGWQDLAEREGFLVVYPQGTSFPQRWNAYGLWGAGAVDDVQFLRDTIEHLSTVAAVDRSRVYVNGFSNGGGMAVRIGCEAAEGVAAIGSVAGAVVDLEACTPSRALPVIAVHGTADPLVRYEGGRIRGWVGRLGARLTRAPSSFMAVEEWVARWAEGQGCDPAPDRIPRQGDVEGRRYTGCDEGVEVVLYTIDGGGHTWPGGPPVPGLGKTSRDIDATEVMWRFFAAYRLEELP
jgi:polyhydroxybutyrate depolymerase